MLVDHWVVLILLVCRKKKYQKYSKFDTMNGSHLGPQFSNSEIKKSLTTLELIIIF